MLIKMLICDKCNKSKDLQEMRFGGQPDTWQKLNKDINTQLDFCSFNCLFEYLKLERNNG